MGSKVEKPLGRVLSVTSNLPRWEGDSTTPFVLNLAEDMQRLGWQIDLLAPHAYGSALQEQIHGVNIERYRYFVPESQQTVCYQGGALVNLRKNKVNYLKLPALLAAAYIAVLRRLHGRSYDLIHSHWILPQGFIDMLAKGGRPLPHVVTVHGGDIFGLSSKLMGWAKARALRSADAVTVNSMYTQRAVNELAPGLERVHCIPLGVSTQNLNSSLERMAARLRAEHRKGDGPLLVFVGRVVDEKGVEDLLHAMLQIRRDFPDSRALIVGDGQDRAALTELSESLGLGDCVSFIGWVGPGEVCAYYAAADIFAAPSRRAVDGWVEAQGLSVLESMIARTPVIATNLGGVSDSIVHERTGLLVDERSPDQLVAAVRRLVEDPALTESIVDNAYTLASERFSRVTSASNFSDLFQLLIAEQKPAS